MAEQHANSSGPLIQPASPKLNNSLDEAIVRTLAALIAGEITGREAVAHLQLLCATSRFTYLSDGIAQHYGPMSDVVGIVLARA